LFIRVVIYLPGQLISEAEFLFTLCHKHAFYMYRTIHNSSEQISLAKNKSLLQRTESTEYVSAVR